MKERKKHPLPQAVFVYMPFAWTRLMSRAGVSARSFNEKALGLETRHMAHCATEVYRFRWRCGQGFPEARRA